MSAVIKRQEHALEFYTKEKCYISELSNSRDDPAVSIAQARVLPGVTTCWHQLTGTFERYYIVAGSGLMELGKLEPQEVNAGDIVLIPPNCRQRITNVGSSDLVFLAICTPRYSNDAYQEIECEPS